MSTTLNISSAGDVRNALILARVCELAYYNEPEGPARFRSELGMTAQLISANNTQVYIAETDESIVVAFRGSEAPTTLDGFKDWLLTNANNYLILPEGRAGTDFVAAGVGARFHKGFLEALEMIWEPMLSRVNYAIKAKDRPVWVTGHSLGGALALLAAWRLQRSFVSIHEIVTFGAPMIGNDVAAKAFEQEFSGKIYRFVDLEDVVPHLPSVSLIANAYTHCQHEVGLEAGPSVAVTNGLEALKGAASAGNDGAIDNTMADQLWEVVKARIMSHMIGTYQSRVEARCKELS